ncbi:carbohydrate sulfotransferase 11-like isoform X2 [Panulirus ornatus]
MCRWTRRLLSLAAFAIMWTLWHGQLLTEDPGTLTALTGESAGEKRSNATKRISSLEGSTVQGTHSTTGSSVANINATVTEQDPWTAEQVRRREAVARACRGWHNLKENLPKSRSDLIHLLVDDRHKAIYCYVPKVACTTWKRLWLILSGISNATNPLDIPEEKPHVDHHKMMLVKQPYNTTYLQRKLYTYTKFLVVRDPYERLVSAFRDKFEGTGSAYYQQSYGYHIMKKYRHTFRGADIPKSGKGLTFTEFVRYIIDHPSERADEHWKPYSLLCYPCAIQYDVISKYETLAEDSERFLRLIKAPEDLHFPAFNPSNTSALLSSYMGRLSSRQRKALRRNYQKDFRMFQYQE